MERFGYGVEDRCWWLLHAAGAHWEAVLLSRFSPGCCSLADSSMPCIGRDVSRAICWVSWAGTSALLACWKWRAALTTHQERGAKRALSQGLQGSPDPSPCLGGFSLAMLVSGAALSWLILVWHPGGWQRGTCFTPAPCWAAGAGRPHPPALRFWPDFSLLFQHGCKARRGFVGLLPCSPPVTTCSWQKTGPW